MNGGFVVIHRSLWKHPVFRNFQEAAAFAWMISRAAWQPATVRYKDRVIHLKRGQLAISVRDLASKLGWNRTGTGRYLFRLKTETMIGTATETGICIITICNYDKYQIAPNGAGTAAGHEVGQGRDRAGTQNNKGNESNEEIPLRGAEAPSVEKQVFDLGKSVLGKKSGGLITRLRKCLDDDGRALALLNEAKDKSDPTEWIAAVIRNNGSAGEDAAYRGML